MEGIQVSAQTAGSQNQISIIKVGGYIDTTTSSEVERALNNLLKQGRYQIIIDLGNVDYISSAGWGIFISEIKAIRENNGDLKLVNMIPDVYEIFELLEFHHILDVYDSVQAAVGKFEESQYVEMVSKPQPTSSETPQREPQYAAEAPASQPKHETTATPLQASSSPQPSRPSLKPEFESVADQGSERKKTLMDLVNMSDEEKIKYIIAQNPDIGAFKINKRLSSADFGFTRVGWWGVRTWLNKLGLNNRQKRRKFAQIYQHNN